MNRKNLLLASAAGIACAAALAWAFMPRPLEVEVALARTGQFEQAIEEDGRTRLKDRYTVSAPVAARLSRIALKAGDAVRAGDVVAELMPVMSPMVDERSMREASARLGAAGAGLARARAQLGRADVAMEEAWRDLQRTERLAAEGFVAASRLEGARLAVSASRRARDAAAAELDAAVQEQALARAALSPPGAGLSGKPLAVRAPVSGRVLRVAQPSEGTLAAGTALLDIGDPANLEVVSELLTTDAVLTRPGARVVIERWGGPPLGGRIRHIEPAAFTKVSALGIEEQRANAVIDVDSPPPAWQAVGDGFRVDVRIVTASVPQALLVPVGAVFPHGDRMAVYRVVGGRARLQVVDLAGRNGAQAWVRSGLAADQAVVLYPAAEVREGARVRVRAP